MSPGWRRIAAVARREFLTTVRRRAFLFTLIGTPAYFALVMAISTGAELKERDRSLKDLRVLGVVDSSGLFENAGASFETEVAADANPLARRGPEIVPGPTRRFRTAIVRYDDLATADRGLREHKVNQVLVIPPDYLEHGAVRRYARSSGLFTSTDRRTVSAWLARSLVRGRVDSLVAMRVARPSENEALYTLDDQGRFELKDDARELLDFMLPMMFSLLLGLCIIIGGQYLLQGVAEEKETRILESLLCTVSSEELMAGKLFGLGAVGLTVVAAWTGAGVALAGTVLAAMQITIPAWWLLVAVLYFVLGYLFFGSIMTGIGAVTNNMREAQQFAVWFTFANFVPFILITTILGEPDSALAVGLSLFPPTASTAMMMRLAAPSSAVPFWQIALSLALLGASAWLSLRASARVFRIGLLMYGKSPSLPEIWRWARSR